MAKVVGETARLRLREWGPEDERPFYDVMNRADVMRYLGGVQTPEQWNAAYSRILGFQRDHGHTFWIVEDRDSSEMLGFCGIKRVNSPGAGGLTGMHEVGWRLRPEAWRRGIAKEAAIERLDLAFGRFGAPAVIAMTVPDNEASQAVMKRLGMTRREDLDFIDTRFGPDLNPSIVYWMSAEDWVAARERALQPR